MLDVLPVIPLAPIFTDEPTEGDTFVSTFTDVHVPSEITVRIAEPEAKPATYADGSSAIPTYVADWDSFVGQQHIKDELATYIDAHFTTQERLPHILLAATMPGAGKTTLARLIAAEIEQRIIMLAPPFEPEALYAAMQELKEHEILFIDEIHRLKKSAAENLLHAMEEHTLYLNGDVIHLEPFTVIGATTDSDKLPEAVLDRFTLQPFYTQYTDADMVRIVHNFCKFFSCTLEPRTMVALAKASQSSPRISRGLVQAAATLQTVLNRSVTGQEVLDFKSVDPDGMTRKHKNYVATMLRSCEQHTKDGIVYRGGESTMMTLLREGKDGVARVERYLIEKGFIFKHGQGRELTPKGIVAARSYIARGEV